MLIAALLTPLALASASAVQQPAAVPPARWISSWDHGECLLTRAIGNAEALSVRTTPGSGYASLWIRRPAASSGPHGSNLNGVVTLLPGDRQIESGTVEHFRYRGDTLYIIWFPSDVLLARLESATSVRVAIERTQLVDLPLGNAAGAVNIMRQCMDDQLRSWGIDPTSLSSLSQRPTPLHARGFLGYFSDGDYPDDALRAGHQGAATVRLNITPEGTVAECTTLVSSGHRSLDTRTCLIFTRRARFRPALNATGAPTSAPLILTIYWRIGRF